MAEYPQWRKASGSMARLEFPLEEMKSLSPGEDSVQMRSPPTGRQSQNTAAQRRLSWNPRSLVTPDNKNNSVSCSVKQQQRGIGRLIQAEYRIALHRIESGGNTGARDVGRFTRYQIVGGDGSVGVSGEDAPAVARVAGRHRAG